MHPSPTQDLGPHPDFPECRVAFDEAAGFFRTVPYPSETALEAFYTREYREIRQESPTDEYVNFMRHRAKAQADFILAHSGRTHFERVLDIGCGCGELLNALQPYADELHGYETDLVMANYAKANRLCESIEIHNDHYQPNKHSTQCDLVTMSHVLEHIPDPQNLIAEITNISIDSSGFIFIEVPNEQMVDLIRKQINTPIKGLGHINYFTISGLGMLLTNSGFEIIASRLCGLTIADYITINNRNKWFSRIYKRLPMLSKRNSKKVPDYTSGGDAPRMYIQIFAKK